MEITEVFLRRKREKGKVTARMVAFWRPLNSSPEGGPKQLKCSKTGF